MAKYRKKPVVIDAIQMTEEMLLKRSLPKGVGGFEYPNTLLRGENNPYAGFYVDTLEGRMGGKPGDWLITGIKGEKYFCAPEIFKATYDEV